MRLKSAYQLVNFPHINASFLFSVELKYRVRMVYCKHITFIISQFIDLYQSVSS